METQDCSTMSGLAAPELAQQDRVDLAPLGTADAHAVVTPIRYKGSDAAIVGGTAPEEAERLNFKQLFNEGKRFGMMRAPWELKGCALSRAAANDGRVYSYFTHLIFARELLDLVAVVRFLDQLEDAHA